MGTRKHYAIIKIKQKITQLMKQKKSVRWNAKNISISMQNSDLCGFFDFSLDFDKYKMFFGFSSVTMALTGSVAHLYWS